MASRKGKPNKITASVKEDIVAVFTRLGGTAAMADWARENPTDFYTKLWAKIIPRTIEGDVTVNVADDITERMTAAKEKAAAVRRTIN